MDFQGKTLAELRELLDQVSDAYLAKEAEHADAATERRKRISALAGEAEATLDPIRALLDVSDLDPAISALATAAELTLRAVTDLALVVGEG